MKKTDVMKQITDTRKACEAANARFRDTANVLDPSKIGKSAGGITRPATEEERRAAIIDAYLWVSVARRRAERAAEMALEFAKQNGISVDEIVKHGKQA